MSVLEKTGNKLLASIRKTKAGADTTAVKTAKKKTTASKATKTAAASKTKKPTTARKQATPKKVAAKKKAKSHVTASNKTRIKAAITVSHTNPFPDGSQVWPD